MCKTTQQKHINANIQRTNNSRTNANATLTSIDQSAPPRPNTPSNNPSEHSSRTRSIGMFSRTIPSLALVVLCCQICFFTSISAFIITPTPTTPTTTTKVNPRRRDDSHYPHQTVKTIATTTVTALGTYTVYRTVCTVLRNLCICCGVR